MSIIIQNMSTHDSPTGEHSYELRINREVITGFTHTREEGLATCLRRAADAADAASDARYAALLHDLFPHNHWRASMTVNQAITSLSGIAAKGYGDAILWSYDAADGYPARMESVASFELELEERLGVPPPTWR